MTNNILPCNYGVHGVIASDMRKAKDGFSVCKGCLTDYNNHDGFTEDCCSDMGCPNQIEKGQPMEKLAIIMDEEERLYHESWRAATYLGPMGR